MTMTELIAPWEEDLVRFLADREEAEAIRLRTLAHAWTGGGGALNVGKHTIRLIAGAEPYTAGTLHTTRGELPARLELARVILEKHGIDNDRWVYWCDEFADLEGFEAGAKFPTVPVLPLTDAELVRLVMGLRDLARMAAQAAP